MAEKVKKEKKFDLDAFKDSLKMADTPLKEDTFVVLDECLQSLIGMPGIPLGHITQIFGKSDTGKTSLLFEIAAAAQVQGILPVVIITEGKVDWQRAEAMGFNRDRAIINENCEYLEDVFEFVDKISASVSNGDLPYNVIILFDSIGNTLSREEVEEQPDGTVVRKSTMMKAAKVITGAMRVLSKKINNTRKISYPKAVGWVILNQAYTQPPTFPGGPSKLTPYGGDAVWYRASLVLRTAKVKKLEAVKNKIKYGFGIVSKITVDKNHITSTTNQGEFIVTADKIIPNEKKALEDYKSTHSAQWGEMDIKVVADGEVDQDIDF